MNQGGYRPGAPLQNAGMNSSQEQIRMAPNWAQNGPPPMAPYLMDTAYSMMPVAEAVYNPNTVPGHEYIPNPQPVHTTPKQNNKVPVGRVNITTCTNCKHNNYSAEIELEKMDKCVEALKSENENLKYRIKELEEELAGKQTVHQGKLASKDDNTVNLFPRTSKLSANAEEFSPKCVPVVSAKGIVEEESMQLSPPMDAKKNNNEPRISSEEAHKKETNANVSDVTWDDSFDKSKPDVKINTEFQPNQDNPVPDNWDEPSEPVKLQSNQDNSTLSVQNNSQKKRRNDGESKPKGHDNRGKTKRTYDHTQKSTNASYGSRSEKSGSLDNQWEERTHKSTHKQKEYNPNHSDQRNKKRPSQETPSTSVESTGGASKREEEAPQNRQRNWSSGNNNHGDARAERGARRWSDSSRQLQDGNRYYQNHSQDVRDGGSVTAKKTKDIIEEIKADLFSAPPEYALAHCVAQDFRMGSGIAVQFKQQFRRTGELLDQHESVGGCAYLEDKKNNRYIFYLVTKPLSNLKPTYVTFRNSVEALKNKCQKFNVKKLAIPHMGCGLDKLDWNKVKGIINEVFCDSNIEIRAYDFNEEGLPEAEGNRPKGYSVYVVYKVMELTNLEKYSVFLFFGTEDGYVDATAKRLNEKLNFLSEYKSAAKRVGSVWSSKKNNDYYVYSLIVQKTFAKNSVTFINLESCCRELMKLFRTDEVVYVGLECLAEWSDDTFFTEKTVTMLRHCLNKPVREIWVCFRNENENISNTIKYPYI